MNSNKPKNQGIKKKRNKNTQTALFTKSLDKCAPKYLMDFEANKEQMLETSHITESLKKIIKQAYTIFKYEVPNSFDVCTRCCVTPREEKALKTIPRHLMPTELIRSYNESAKNKIQNKEEVAYLLPRILELTALDQNIYHSIELYLSRIGRVNPNLWLYEERKILEEFAIEYLFFKFNEAAEKQEIVFLDEIFVMYGIGGIDIRPVLERIKSIKNWYMMTSIAYLLMQQTLSKTAFADQCPQVSLYVDQWFKENKQQLKQNALYAISHGETISISSNVEYLRFFIEQSLVELSEIE